MSFAEPHDEEPTPRQAAETAKYRSKKRMVWSRIWRFTAGIVVIITGIALGPLPGPGGIPLIIAGLAIMAPVFPPAERLLHWMKRKFDHALKKARAARRRHGHQETSEPKK